MSFDITIADGDFLWIDTETRSVLLNGTASRFPNKSSNDWIDLQPGVNEITFRASTPSAASMTMSFRSAWV
jgi:hypothetical protein